MAPGAAPEAHAARESAQAKTEVHPAHLNPLARVVVKRRTTLVELGMLKNLHGFQPLPALLGTAIGLAVLLAGCGGRQPRIIAEQSPTDGRLSCEHLQGERAINEARILELGNERTTASRNNVGAFLAGGIFMMDLNDTEAQEIEALQRRNARLDALSAQASCVKAHP
jgi:hypothetical protein